MKFFLPLILAASFLPGAAIAQVSVNPAALNQLAGLPATPPVTAHETAPNTDHAAFVRHWRHVATQAKHLSVKKPAPPVIMPAVAEPPPALPDLPGAAPAAPDLRAPKPPVTVPAVAKPAVAAPVAPKPAVAEPPSPLPDLPGAAPAAPDLRAPKPPATVPAVAKPAVAAPVAPKPAVPKPAARPATLDIAFAADSATLPADAATRLAPFCKIAGPIVINARAPADPDDNSQSMRLSLARALAVRASLSACGVPSQNILPRALGAAPGGAPDTTEIQAGLNP